MAGSSGYTQSLLFRRPSGGGLGLSALRGGASASSASASTTHTFQWDLALKAQLEGAAVRHFPKRDKPALARFAKENYRLVEQGHYLDVAGEKHSLKLPRDAINRILNVPASSGQPLAPRHAQTSVCVARIDTATALRTMSMLGAKRVAALNFANAHHPGGGYLNGARAQEEDLCRLMPTLYSSLKRLKYPMKESTAFFTQTWLCRTAGSYAFEQPPLLTNIVSSAMPDLGSGGWRGARLEAGSPAWEATVRARMRAVLHAAREEGCDCVVLGAFGCGAFGNPPELVARLFAAVLASGEFRGAFAQVVFAILEFKDTDGGNVHAFVRACGPEKGGLCEGAAPDHAPDAPSTPPAEPPAPMAMPHGPADGGAGGAATAGAGRGESAEEPMDVSEGGGRAELL